MTDKLMSDYLITFVTAESEEQARQIGRALVERRLAACVNLAPVTSLFAWEGQIEQAGEVLMIIKTRAALFDSLVAAVRELHSYEVPEIVALPIVHGSADYLRWISEVTGG